MADNQQTGLIVKATGGFYYVLTPDGTRYQCRARGVFRKEKRSPCVGDRVDILLPPEGDGTVMEIHPRRNTLIRPPLANLDQMGVVISTADPAPNLYVLDQFLAVLEYKEIEPLIIVTKADVSCPDDLARLYEACGFRVFVVSSKTGQGLEEVRHALTGKISAFSGNSGVGKSSLLNAIDPRLDIETGETSKKLGRGRHTTRHVELFPVEGGWVADTPGFSTMELTRMETIYKEHLAGCFRDFAPYREKCRFHDCLHGGEKGCAVKAAADEGKLAPSRYQNYLTMLEGVRNLKEWETERS
ncbi:ribosome small subunit-dependent GTPase A [Oscillospiraceae bacterium MB08-C2-2]|nr:ribosome small subunit-dependent GTPase A [Oscillospiraceae bacterium MB08-C2-2]